MRWTERQRAMLREMGVRAVAAARTIGRAAPWPGRPQAPDAQPPQRRAADAAAAAGSRRLRRQPRDAAHRTTRRSPRWTGPRCAPRRRLPRLRAVRRPHAAGVRRRPSARALDDRRRGAGRAGRRVGRALRRPSGPAARQHAARDRPDPRRGAPPARQVYIANTVKCRPPRQPQPRGRRAGAAARPFLVRQIELVQPRIILAMGRFAVQSAAAQQRADRPAARSRAPLRRACR